MAPLESALLIAPTGFRIARVRWFPAKDLLYYEKEIDSHLCGDKCFCGRDTVLTLRFMSKFVEAGEWMYITGTDALRIPTRFLKEDAEQDCSDVTKFSGATPYKLWDQVVNFLFLR